ncbi:hypothetical protein P3S67_002161 [Capsicum chacoense]
MANKDRELVVTNQIGSSGNENVGYNKEIRKLRRQIIEMHQAWANGLPPPPVPTDNMEYLYSLPPVSHAQFPIFVYMPQHASGSTPGQQYLTTSNVHFLTPQFKTTTYSAPAAVHAFEAPPPPPTFDVHPQVMPPYSTREPALNIFSDQHYALEPTFKSTGPYDCPQPPEFPSNTEKPIMIEEQEEIAKKLRNLELTMKNLQGLGGIQKSHLRRYCNQLRGDGGKEELLMIYFSESLLGLASEWFVDQDIDKWLSWDDLANEFVQQFQYNPFIEVLKMGEMIEEGIKTGSVGEKKNEEDASAIIVGQQERSRRPRRRRSQAQAQVYAQAPHNHSQNLLYFVPPHPYPVYNAQPHVQPSSYPQWHTPMPQSHPLTPQTYQNPSKLDFLSKTNNEMRQKSRDSFTPIGESYASLFQRLVHEGMITPLLGHTLNRRSRNFDPNTRCADRSEAQGHSIEDCRDLKREIEKMIHDGSIMVQKIDSEGSFSHADMQASG